MKKKSIFFPYDKDRKSIKSKFMFEFADYIIFSSEKAYAKSVRTKLMSKAQRKELAQILYGRFLQRMLEIKMQKKPLKTNL